MTERDIRIALLFVCKVAGSDSDFNAVAFHALCDKLKQLGAADEREVIFNLVQKMAARFYKDDAEKAFEELTEAIRARGNT